MQNLIDLGFQIQKRGLFQYFSISVFWYNMINQQLRDYDSVHNASIATPD